MLILQKRLDYFKTELKNNSDLITRSIIVNNRNIGLIYLKSMIDNTQLSENILGALLNTREKDISLKNIKEKIIQSITCDEITSNEKAIINIVKNQLIIIVENESGYLSVDLENYPQRMPTEPPTSSVLKGPREGFTESIKMNLALLRRRLATKELVFKNHFVGKYSNTQVTVVYLNGIADLSIVKKIEKRISKIQIDGIIDSHYISNLIQEKPYSFFKQIGTAEKPDIITAKLLEGRVAIFVDNSPVVLTLPFVFLEEVQNANDYYTISQQASFLRWVRLFGILLSVLVPALYLSLRLYHYKMVPLKFLISISNSTLGIPFSPFVELLFILILFEMLYEVSLRLPRYLGMATSIVGALVLGETGVKAGLISPPAVMIIAMSVIAIYTVPDQSFQLSLLRLVFLLLAAMFGVFGIMAGIVYFINYANSLNGYGAPYLAPISPLVKQDLKDAYFKSPLIDMKKRPISIKNQKSNNQRYNNGR